MASQRTPGLHHQPPAGALTYQQLSAQTTEHAPAGFVFQTGARSVILFCEPWCPPTGVSTDLIYINTAPPDVLREWLRLARLSKHRF